MTTAMAEEATTKDEEPVLLALIMPNPNTDGESRENPLANLDYGRASKNHEGHADLNITFTEYDAGIGRAFVRSDHPLLPSLLERYPQIQVDQGAGERIYVCSECDKEFGSPMAIKGHSRVHKS